MQHRFSLTRDTHTVIVDIAKLTAVLTAVRDRDETRRERSVLGAALGLAAGAESRDGGAVVVAVAKENFGLETVVFALAYLPDDFEGFFIRLGAGAGVIHPTHAGHLVYKLFSEGRRWQVAVSAGDVVHPNKLVADRVGDALTTVADVNCPDTAGDRVKVLAAVDIGHAQTLAVSNNGGLALVEGLVLNQVVPNVGFILGNGFSSSGLGAHTDSGLVNVITKPDSNPASPVRLEEQAANNAFVDLGERIQILARHAFVELVDCCVERAELNHLCASGGNKAPV